MNLKEIANSVADDIERLGHYQGTVETVGENLTSCCVLSNPTVIPSTEYKRNVQEERWGILKPAILGYLGMTGVIGNEVIYDWNDSTPTDEVCRVLRSLE